MSALDTTETGHCCTLKIPRQSCERFTSSEILSTEQPHTWLSRATKPVPEIWHNESNWN